MESTIGAVRLANTVNGSVFEHPSEVLVYVKVNEPADSADTNPELDTVATEVLLDAQVPFVDGVTFAVKPTQILAVPPTIGAPGMALITTFVEDRDVHELLFVTVNE